MAVSLEGMVRLYEVTGFRVEYGVVVVALVVLALALVLVLLLPLVVVELTVLELLGVAFASMPTCLYVSRKITPSCFH